MKTKHDILKAHGHHSGPSRLADAAGRTGFTLLEMLVAVGAVAVISVGLAAVFDAVGKTVSGGKRTSVVNTYSTLLETRLRRDFESMTRDGPLVIRQQWVDTDNDGTYSWNSPTLDRVPIVQDGAEEGRRIDEIIFFTRGPAQTARPNMQPAAPAASADVSRVYYGHGQARPVDVNANSRYLVPTLDDRNDPNAAVGSQVASNPANPNRYAFDWTLLRHETLLVKPETANQAVRQAVFGIDPRTAQGRLRLANKDAQIALQPAAGSIFRSLSRRFPDASLTENQTYLRPDQNAGGVYPAFASGLVDIASDDLGAVRSVINGYAKADPSDPIVLPKNIGPSTVVPPTRSRFMYMAPGSSRPAETLATPVDVMHAWMDDLFPTQSVPTISGPIYPATAAVDPPGVRMRYEPDASELDEVMRQSVNTPAGRLAKAVSRADWLTLCTNNLLPRCTTFIVEWSFGDPDPAHPGEVVWFGLDRRVDSNNDGQLTAADRLAVTVYPNNPAGTPVPHKVDIALVGGGTAQHTVTPRLIYGYAPNSNQAALTSYFGYVDPTFDPPNVNIDGSIPSGEPSVRTLAWSWPRLVRITVTVADQSDPSTQSTFQYVFRTPDDPGS